MKRFVVLGTQRTGTTLVRTSLDSHPDIRCHGEVFVVGRWPERFTRRKPYTEPDGYWAYRRASLPARLASFLQPDRTVARFLDDLYAGNESAIGFKLMLTEAQRFPAAVRYLKANRVAAIHVLRRNLLDVMISRRMARTTGVYHRHADTTPASDGRPARAPLRLTLDTGRLLRDLEAIAEEDRRWQELAYDQLPFMRVYYEDFVASRDARSKELLDFLGVAPRPLSSPLRKVVESDWRQVVVNPQGVEAVLRGTTFEHLLAPLA